MDADRFIDELRPFRRGEVALARGIAGGALGLPAADVDTLRYALRLAQLSSVGPAEDALLEPLSRFRQQLVQTLAPVMPTGPGEMDAAALRAAIEAVAPLVEGARKAVLTSGLATERDLDAEIGNKRLVVVLGGAGACGYVYLGVLARLEELGITPRYMMGCSIGALLAVLRARGRAFELDELLDEIRLLRAVAALGTPTRSRFGLPGAIRVDLHRALAPLFTQPDGSPVRLRDLEFPVEVLATGLGAGALSIPREAYGELIEPRNREASSLAELSGGATARTVAALVAMAMSRRLVVPVLLGADPHTAELPALDAAGFSLAIPGLLQYEPPATDLTGAQILEQLFERNGIAALADGVIASAIPAQWAWERVEAGRAGGRNCVILAVHALEAAQRGAAALLRPLQRTLSATAHRDRPFWDLLVSFRQGPMLFDLLPGPPTLHRAVASGRDEFEPLVDVLRELLVKLPPWREIATKRG